MSRDFAVARRRMVQEQLQGAGIADRNVLQAMAAIPRHRFVPRVFQHRAYEPCALPIGYGQTISKPFTVGLMTALLELQGSERVLEVGTGSGYQAAVLGRLSAEVVTVERIVPLALRAARELAAGGADNVTVVPGDGSGGLADRGPWQAIIVTACAPGLPEAMARQLQPGGYLLVPILHDGEQVLYRYRRCGDELAVERGTVCHFVPLLPGLEAQQHA
ncbi:MAG: protein-L-isoaspartate(D-aspartate) O-methyltransferase [Candidatus Krumholzibacteria bacterium]|nr:protein-L-isoaspartate(D-aspartate) O-methyltransferase [Candidatus Krumholzibacteria bacterium]